MKYFEVQDSPELKYAPRIKDWYGKLDVRNIRIDRFDKLPEIQSLFIESFNNTVFTDMILFPFLLVSPVFQEVIRMYRERCFFRTVILIDPINKESQMYFLPVLDETNEIQIQRISYKRGVTALEMPDKRNRSVELDRNLFWVRDSGKRHIIMSMDMAESLIRRGITGLGLCEVKLWEVKR